MVTVHVLALSGLGEFKEKLSPGVLGFASECFRVNFMQSLLC